MELQPAQVCLIDALLQQGQAPACPACLAEAQPVIDRSRTRIDPLANVSVTFPCGHTFTVSDATLVEAERTMVNASAMYYGWDRPGSSST